MLNRSLSIILPVHNAELILARQVHHLLDILQDFSARFELLIIDDGSTDHTEEIASELAREFPQVRTARHAQQRGSAAALETGMANTSGDIIFLQEERARIMPSDLRRIRSQHDDEQLVMAGSEPQPCGVESGLIHALAAWKTVKNRSFSQDVPPCETGIRDRRSIPTRGAEQTVADIPAASLVSDTTQAPRSASLQRPNFLIPRKDRWPSH